MEIEFQSCVVANGPTSDLNEFFKKISVADLTSPN